MDKLRRGVFSLCLLAAFLVLFASPVFASDITADADGLGNFAGGGEDWWAIGGSIIAFVILVAILWYFGSKWIVENVLTR